MSQEITLIGQLNSLLGFEKYPVSPPGNLRRNASVWLAFYKRSPRDSIGLPCIF
jgi:hypothetical protein